MRFRAASLTAVVVLSATAFGQQPAPSPTPPPATRAPLGLLPPGLPYETTVVEIQPGDCLVICSDGVSDAQNEAGDAFAGVAPQFDDITLLVLRRLAD